MFLSKNIPSSSLKSPESQQVRQLMRMRNMSHQGEIVSIQKQNKGHKIKNDIVSADLIEQQLTNHESSSKICPRLLDYIQLATNQVYVFSGDEEERLETFLGTPNDPGMLMVIMVYIMQEKYKLNHGELELKVSFLEFVGNQFVDLLTEEKILLKQMELCCWVKVNQYLQYLKAVKIALYANKKRDFRVFKFDDQKQSKDSSIFICRIRAKFHEKISQIVLIDVPTLKKKEKTRNSWQSFMHSFKQGTKIQSTQLTQFLFQKLRKGVLTVVHSMNLGTQKISFNIARLRQIQQFCSTNPVSQIKSKLVPHFPQLQSGKIHLHQHIVFLVNKMKTLNYDSVNHLESSIADLLEWKKACLLRINQLGGILLQLLKNRISLTLYNNSSFFQRRDLVGKSVKSQNLKQFYSSKTYQSLYRQVDIKTEQSKKSIRHFLKQNMELKQQFIQGRNKPLPKSSNQQIQVLLKNIGRIVSNYFIKQYLNLKEDTPSYWIYLCAKKVEVDNKIKQFEKDIESMQSDLENVNVTGCYFKQDLIISKRNIVEKVKRFTEPSISKTASLPRLMFKRMENNERDDKPQMEMKLSNFLLKLPKQ